MKKHMVILLFLVAAVCVLPAQEKKWWKGNTHTHTINSDGDELPRRLVRWYLDHNYNFIAITDHDHITPIRYLDTDANDDFILIQGDEVSDSFAGKPVHLCALGLSQIVEPQKGKTLVETLQNNIDAIRRVGAIPQINHPNWKWAFADPEMAQLKNVVLFELYNLNRDCNSFGAGGHPGMEEIWDRILSRGVLMYGLASDDTHEYLGEYLPSKAMPGKAWIMVRAPELSAAAILKALEAGDFYASTGVELNDVRIDEKEYALEIKAEGYAKFTTRFIGQNGKVLKDDFTLKPVYAFKGDEAYVRAKVFSSFGEFACLQPVFMKRK